MSFQPLRMHDESNDELFEKKNENKKQTNKSECFAFKEVFGNGILWLAHNLKCHYSVFMNGYGE